MCGERGSFQRGPWPASWIVVVGMTFTLLSPVSQPSAARGEDPLARINALRRQFFEIVGRERYREAEPIAQEMLRLAEREFQQRPEVIADALNCLAALSAELDNHDQAISLYKRSLALKEKALGPNHPQVGETLNYLGADCMLSGRHAEGVAYLERCVAIFERAYAPDDPRLGGPLDLLASGYSSLGQLGKVEPLLKRALEIAEKSGETDQLGVAESLLSLGSYYSKVGRYTESETLFRRGVELYRQSSKPNSSAIARGLGQLAEVYVQQGRYADAEPLLKQVLALSEQVYGAQHSRMAFPLVDLAALYSRQDRYTEAEQMLARARAIREQVYGPDHPFLAEIYESLARSICRTGRYAEAEQLCRRALAIRERNRDQDPAGIGFSLEKLADVYEAQDRLAEAEPLYRQALEVREQTLGPDHPNVCDALEKLTAICLQSDRAAEAETLAERAVTIGDTVRLAPGRRSRQYQLRAEVAWALDRKSEALADLKEAISLAEEQRGQSSGTEHERATSFQGLTRPFERMVAWQVDLGDVGEALAAMERARARSLLDEMSLGGADLDLARSATEREQLRAQEAELNLRIAELEAQMNSASDSERKQLEQALAQAREALYEHYREQRTTNPLYRSLLGSSSGPPRLSQVQRTMAASDTLVLEYLFGADGGYLLSIDRHGAKLTALSVTSDTAKILGVEPGPLTADRLAKILLRDADQGVDKSGLLAKLAAPGDSQQLAPQMMALWQSLVPADLRASILSGKFQRLMIVPDGALALLPFETLVVEVRGEPQYLLDAGPPIVYGPSLTVLSNLLNRHRDEQQGVSAALTVGDPSYQLADATGATATIPSSGARYRAAGGALAPLPFSGIESRWVADNLRQVGIDVLSLSGAQATESQVRAGVPDRAIVHLACHGLTDQAYGNFFGALALAPSAARAAGPADDGFMTLSEIYALDLAHCELAILSACQTNFGEHQKGEGVWALSRGFLVAGSRRVVASNWLVDDEAAASLVSYFTAGLARAKKTGDPLAYAEALHAAKRWVHEQAKWQSPYYWGAFVLIGPN